MTILLDIY